MRADSRRRAQGSGAVHLIERLEQRQLLASVAIDATNVLRTADARMYGTNLAWWQAELDTTRLEDMARDAGMKVFRMPGGTSSNDNRHFDTTNPGEWYNTPPEIASFIEHVGGDGSVCVNYGTGSPQEAAAYLAYYNAEVGDTTPIGVGMQWDDNANTWVAKDWQTAGYWASIRAAAPLAVDDGLNFLRVSHPDPWGFTYYEVGNENFAIWENDKHGQGGDPGAPQDPATYAGFAATFAQLAKQIDPNVKIGVVVTLPMQWNLPDQDWTQHLLEESAALGFVPDMLIDHVYVTNLSDQDLLLNSTNSDSYFGWMGHDNSWAGRAEYYRTRIDDVYGAAGAGIELAITEFNSDLSNKQSTNLVNGLWVADSIGGLLQTEYSMALQWDLTNGFTPLPDDPTHYGWREGADNGMISTGGDNAPESGPYIPYPVYFSMQLASHWIAGGGSVVHTASDDEYLATYAVLQDDGDLALLVINKSPTQDISGSFDVTGFAPNTRFRAWQYGIDEDTAQSQSFDGSSQLSEWSGRLNMSGSGFDFSFPAYSMTVLEVDTGAIFDVVGTPGNDYIYVTGNDWGAHVYVNGVLQTLPSTYSELLIDAGAGDDVVWVTSTVMVPMLITGGSGNDTIVGGSADDELSGASGRDRIFGGRGDDYLLGGKGNDYLSGDGGHDLLSGGGGRDRLYGGSGYNWLRGGAGNDVLFSRNGNADIVSGNAGYDIAVDPDDYDLEYIAGIEQILQL